MPHSLIQDCILSTRARTARTSQVYCMSLRIAYWSQQGQIQTRSGNIDEQWTEQEERLRIDGALVGQPSRMIRWRLTKFIGEESKLSVTEIEKEISDKWKQAFKGSSWSNKNSLAMKADRASKSSKSKFGRRFKGGCRKCGKQGHKASDCRSGKKGVCLYCGEDGHFAKNCPKNVDNKATLTGMFVRMVEHSMKATKVKHVNKSELFLPDYGAGLTWAEFHSGQEVPTSLRIFASDLQVDVSDDQITDWDSLTIDFGKVHEIS